MGNLTIAIIETIGYLGSILVAISLMMKNILKLRIINMAGAFFFMVYSLIIGTYPIFIVNLVIFLVDLYYLYVILTKEELFSTIHIEDRKSPFLKTFVDFYYDDIKKFFPRFEPEILDTSHVLVVLRDMVPVGLFISRESPKNEKQIEILVDYIIPEYRDFKNAHFVYKKEIKKYKKQGYESFITRTKNGTHKEYLLKMGYTQDDKDASLYKREF
jgi:hypothetical protein